MDVDGSSSDFWELVELFYKAVAEFQRLHASYEKKVIDHAASRGVDRALLKLNAEEVAELFDFRAVRRLRDDFIAQLKHKAHKLFRTTDSTDTFDRAISEIFHEISILKEEHFTVKTYGTTENKEITDLILEEVHRYFPIRLSKIHVLFARARSRLEALLPLNAGNRILVRSLYIFGDDLLRDVYAGGLTGFYARMYPGGGAREGYFQAGRSFYEAGFWELSQEALERARMASPGEEKPLDGRLHQIEDLLKQIRLKTA